MCLNQIYVVYKQKKDRVWLKTLVLVLWLFASIHLVAAPSVLYYNLIATEEGTQNYLNPHGSMIQLPTMDEPGHARLESGLPRDVKGRGTDPYPLDMNGVCHDSDLEVEGGVESYYEFESDTKQSGVIHGGE
ncbi:hypothetical protein BDY19DRAFT_1047830 [Irpex rosettiformis]|uniref:Uncharacterized protein n=1 Tax=Irpex rosettiformis TaxID=378272 RepID=A0ACB8U5Z3_9APHY|nr:hypothetical protein BDY19DRAFT_1047830 [Irpex rosettiformis]